MTKIPNFFMQRQVDINLITSVLKNLRINACDTAVLLSSSDYLAKLVCSDKQQREKNSEEMMSKIIKITKIVQFRFSHTIKCNFYQMF